MGNQINKFAFLYLGGSIFASTLISLTYGALLAYAAPPAANMLAPFDTGSTWNVCQGYNHGSHNASYKSNLSLDLTDANCDNSATNRRVRAPFSGTVAWYVEASGSMCLTSDSSNLSVMFTHINKKVNQGANVSAYQEVGRVAKAGDRQNNNVAHLHLQAFSTPRCGNGSLSDQIPFDTANGASICGLPDLTVRGPNSGNGTWSNTRFTTSNCVTVPLKKPETMYRFWSDVYKHHFYTIDYKEAMNTARKWPTKWSYEPKKEYEVSSLPCKSGTSPVYRFWSPKYNGHFYTIDPVERDRVMTKWPTKWSYEGEKFCASTNQTAEYSKPAYRFWSARYKGHFYTTDEAERDRVIAKWPDVWTYENTAFYVKR